ncbi:MAG: tryptophan-rich sensory protein [Clostridia bacterium]|nr:tryptophan-rich sensory protein [Clostridia bacterium]
MKKQDWWTLAFYVISAELVGALSALLSGGFSDFFDKYEQPPLQPPQWLFPVVWVILYAVMGVSAYLIHTADTDSISRKNALTLYWAQLGVNFSWSIVFFRFEWLWLAVAVIFLLLALIVSMIISFRKIRPVAGNINFPYLVWVAFATYLNIAIAVIN